MQIETTKTDMAELKKLLDWSYDFIRRNAKGTRDDDHARRINRIIRRINEKNKEVLGW